MLFAGICCCHCTVHIICLGEVDTPKFFKSLKNPLKTYFNWLTRSKKFVYPSKEIKYKIQSVLYALELEKIKVVYYNNV